jgi:hypothetical protein
LVRLGDRSSDFWLLVWSFLTTLSRCGRVIFPGFFGTPGRAIFAISTTAKRFLLMENEYTPNPRDIATQLIISGILAAMSPEQRASALSMTEKLLNAFVSPAGDESDEIKEFARYVEIETYKMLRGLRLQHENESH